MSEPLRCKHCPRTSHSSPDVARAAGWRMFKGVSVTGKPLDDVVCPVCSGLATPTEPVKPWLVGCSTCDWQYEADYDGDQITTEEQAVSMARLHQCEPDLWARSPEGEPFAVTSTGKLLSVGRAGASR